MWQYGGDCCYCRCRGGDCKVRCIYNAGSEMRFCPPPTPRGCVDSQGKFWRDGDRYTEDCNTCTCRCDGEECAGVCSKRHCPPIYNPDGCEDSQGNMWQEGEAYKDNCNNCTCNCTKLDTEEAQKCYGLCTQKDCRPNNAACVDKD